MFPQDQILNQVRRRRVLEPPFATPPIALDQDAEEAKTDPWSERLPDGRTVNEAVMEALQRSQRNPSNMGGQGVALGERPAGDQQEPPITASLDPNRPPPSGMETRPWKVGGSLEQDPLKREAARIRAMIENPRSKVTREGAVEPPEKMNRWKALGLGALFGLAQGGPDTPLAARLAAGATGAGLGAAKPSLVQDWRRRMEVEDAQGQLAKQQKLGLGQAQLESEQAETEQRRATPIIAAAELERKARYDQARVQIQREVAEGRKSIADATRELRALELEERKRHNLETERQGRERPTSDAQAAQAAEGEAIAAETQAAADSLKAELDKQKGQLMENERAITQKESLWNSQAAKIVADSAGEVKLPEALAQVQAADPDYVNGTYAQTVQNTKALREAVSEGDKRLASMAEDIRKGKAKGARGGQRSSGTGRKWSASKWAADPRNKGLDVEAAKRQAKAEGYTVVE